MIARGYLQFSKYTHTRVHISLLSTRQRIIQRSGKRESWASGTESTQDIIMSIHLQAEMPTEVTKAIIRREQKGEGRTLEGCRGAVERIYPPLSRIIRGFRDCNRNNRN